jgi:hypothetical protein
VHDTRKKPARVSKTVPDSVRNEVLARSRGRCEAPGCRNRGYLELHHLHGRGAGHQADTILNLCSAHHRAPHQGKLRIQGQGVSTGLVVRLADDEVVGRVGGGSSRDAVEQQTLALKALRKVQIPAREAKPLLQRALVEKPELWEAGVEDLVRAVLLRL